MSTTILSRRWPSRRRRPVRTGRWPRSHYRAGLSGTWAARPPDQARFSPWGARCWRSGKRSPLNGGNVGVSGRLALIVGVVLLVSGTGVLAETGQPGDAPEPPGYVKTLNEFGIAGFADVWGAGLGAGHPVDAGDFTLGPDGHADGARNTGGLHSR